MVDIMVIYQWSMVDISFGLNLMSSSFFQITRNITSTRHQDISVIQLCCIQAIGIDGI